MKMKVSHLTINGTAPPNAVRVEIVIDDPDKALALVAGQAVELRMRATVQPAPKAKRKDQTEKKE
jgi:hypothetical protein